MKVGILGAGGWGTALAIVLSKNNHHVTLWTRNDKHAEIINTTRTNPVYLPGATIPKQVTATTEPYHLRDVSIVVIAVPTQHIRGTILTHQIDLTGKIVVNVSKGLERGTMSRISQILHQCAEVSLDSYVDLTGPSHAEEVARGIPTTVVAASYDEEIAKIVQKTFMTPEFRVYSSCDVVGAELAGAMKNVIAISSGILDGLDLGDNPKAALMTRGLAEMSRLGIKLGANPHTFSGLAGLGDLIVTCQSKHSRNRFVGEQIGKGKKPSDILASMQQVAEGVPTTEATYLLARKHDVEMPIVEQVYKILFEDKEPQLAIRELMQRKSKSEIW